MKKKPLIAISAALLAANMLTVVCLADYENRREEHLRIFDYSDSEEEGNEYYRAFFDMCKNGADEADKRECFRERFTEDDGMMDGLSLSEEQREFFNDKENKIVKISFTIEEPYRDDWDLNSVLWFELYTDKYREIKKCYYLDERYVYTTKGIRSDCTITADENICWGLVLANQFVNKITDINFYPCTSGWNTIDGEQYYVKSDGCLATKSMVIDGVRYKFGKSGVCEGKYTGWTKSSKGRRYWKNGVLIKNKTLRTKSGKVYRLDSKGYATLKA